MLKRKEIKFLFIVSLAWKRIKLAYVGLLRCIKAWEVQFYSKIYAVTKLLISGKGFEIYYSINFMNVGTLI